jgi:hypothetical protein
MRRLRSLFVLAFCLLAIPNLQAQTKKLTPAEAKDHIGDRATVCGKIASTHYAKSSKGEPTFLNLDEPYPKELALATGLSARVRRLEAMPRWALQGGRRWTP